jgi:hypothetical protein
MKTPTKKVAMRPKSDRRINNPEFTRLDRDIILGDIEAISEAENWPLDQDEHDSENEFDNMPSFI